MRWKGPSTRNTLLVIAPFVVVGFVLDRLHVPRAYVPPWVGLLVLVLCAASMRRREP